MAIEPGDRAAPGIEAMGALLQPVPLARIDHELGRDAALDQPGVEFLRLAERRAAILAAMEDQGRRGRAVEPRQRRALDGEPAKALLVLRPADDELAEIMVAGIVAAPLVG